MPPREVAVTESSVLATSPLRGDSHGSWGWNWKMVPLPGSDLGLNAGLCLHYPIKPLSWRSLGLWVAQPAAGWGTRAPLKALGGCRLPFPLTHPKTPLCSARGVSESWEVSPAAPAMHSWLRHEQPTAETLLGFQDEGQAGMSSWLETWGTRGQLK